MGVEQILPMKTPEPWDKSLVKDFDYFLFDCDGVLYKQNTVIDGSERVLKKLITLNKQILFISNSSTKDINMYIEKFQNLFNISVKPNIAYCIQFFSPSVNRQIRS